jgi:hypothetical protein
MVLDWPGYRRHSAQGRGGGFVTATGPGFLRYCRGGFVTATGPGFLRYCRGGFVTAIGSSFARRLSTRTRRYRDRSPLPTLYRTWLWQAGSAWA